MIKIIRPIITSIALVVLMGTLGGMEQGNIGLADGFFICICCLLVIVVIAYRSKYIYRQKNTR